MKGKLSSLCYAFRILSNISNKEVLNAYYFGCIQSVLSYGIIFWGTSHKSLELFKLQKRIVKAMLKVPIRTSSRPVFRELNILPLPSLHILESVYFIHCNKNYFKLNSDYHDHFTRTAKHIHLDTHRTTKYINSIAHQGINLYNKLPISVKNLDSKKFKHKVCMLLKNYIFFSVDDYLLTSLVLKNYFSLISVPFFCMGQVAWLMSWVRSWVSEGWRFFFTPLCLDRSWSPLNLLQNE